MVVPAATLFMLLAIPAWADGSEGFDPDQPFHEAEAKNLLRAWFNHALNILDDHLEVTGALDQDQAKGDHRSHLRLKFYPEGKSTSDKSISAEGWVERSPDGRRQELHFRFTLPEPSSEKSSEQIEHVL